MKIATSIVKTGPFFEHDPAKTFAQNLRASFEALAHVAQDDVRAQLKQGEGSRYSLGLGLGRVSQHVIGRADSLSGKHWKATAVVSVNNIGFSKAQGVKLMAAASYLEGTLHPFRRTAMRLRSARIRQMNTAELMRNIA